jgi:hypothetical protein
VYQFEFLMTLVFSVAGLLVSGSLGFCLQWAELSLVVFLLMAGYISVCIFPTSVRTMNDGFSNDDV